MLAGSPNPQGIGGGCTGQAGCLDKCTPREVKNVIVDAALDGFITERAAYYLLLRLRLINE